VLCIDISISVWKGIVVEAIVEVVKVVEVVAMVATMVVEAVVDVATRETSKATQIIPRKLN